MNPQLNMPGAWAGIKEVPPSLLPINQNQTLYVAKLTDYETANTPTPEKKEGLKSVEEVLQHYQPQKTVFLNEEKNEEEDGQAEEVFKFRKIADFTQQGLINQSPTMQAQSAKVQDLKKINMHLRSNRMLQKALQNAEGRNILRAMIAEMIEELTEPSQS